MTTPETPRTTPVQYGRQVVDEMRKVVYPTRNELRSYTVAVVVFLFVIMAYVNGLDAAISGAVRWVFGD